MHMAKISHWMQREKKNSTEPYHTSYEIWGNEKHNFSLFFLIYHCFVTRTNMHEIIRRYNKWCMESYTEENTAK